MKYVLLIPVLLAAVFAAFLFSIALGVSFLHALLVIIGARFAMVAVTYNGSFNHTPTREEVESWRLK